MEIIDLGSTVFTVHEVHHHAGLQRPRTIQGQHGDNVFKSGRPQTAQQLLHPTRFQLEHRCRITFAQQLVGGVVIQWQGHDVELALVRIELAYIAHGPVQNRQVTQPQKVELDQAGSLHVVLVVLRHGVGVRARLGI